MRDHFCAPLLETWVRRIHRLGSHQNSATSGSQVGTACAASHLKRIPWLP